MRRLLPFLSLFAALAFGAYIYASDGYTASYNTAVSITGPDSICKRVTNANANSEYIPTASTAEWQSFVSNPPSNVSVNSCTCSLPWGGSASEGQSVTAYAASSVACGSSCTSQTRTCSNGTLSGSYSYGSCSVNACASCALPWGGAIAHGQSVTAYYQSSVACGGSCYAQTRTCNNGTLSGSYTSSSCSVGSCNTSCNMTYDSGCAYLWGSTIGTSYGGTPAACAAYCGSVRAGYCVMDDYGICTAMTSQGGGGATCGGYWYGYCY